MDQDDVRPPSDDGSSGNSSDSEIIPEEVGAPLIQLSNTVLQPKKSSLAPPLQTAHSAGVAGTQHHRPRGASVWTLPSTSVQQGQSGGAHAGGGGTTSRTRQRDVYEIEHALQYRAVMKQHVNKGSAAGSNNTPLSFSEQLHVTALLQSYLIVNGFSRTTAALQSAVPICASFALGKEPSEALDCSLLVAEEARRTSMLFDDDTYWRLTNLFKTDIPLVSLDASSQAVGGPVDLLFEKLILGEKDAPYVDGKPDFHFTNIFIVMAPFFCCPDVLLTHATKLFKTIAQQRVPIGESRADELQRRILNVLRSYLSLNSADFTITTLERLTAFCVSATMGSARRSTDVSASVTALQTVVQGVVVGGTAKRIGVLIPTTARSGQHAATANSQPVPRFGSTGIIRSILDIDDKELCRQICLLSFSLFEQVHVRELFHNAWTDQAGLKPITANISALMEFSHKFQLWIASLVVQPIDVETRRTTYRKLIRVCGALYNAQNYEMVNSVLEGLRNSAVQRLKSTVECIESEEREELEGLVKVMDPFDNTLQDVSYHIDSPSIPIIAPLLGVFYRAEDNGRSTAYVENLQAQAVNWSKMIQLAKPTFRWISFQSVKYPYYVLPDVQRYLWQMPGRLHPERLVDTSLQREGPTR